MFICFKERFCFGLIDALFQLVKPVNDAVRKAFPIKKVTSSHSKGQTQILCENRLDEDALRSTISATGYQVLSIQSAPYEKKGLFSFRK